MQTERKRFPHLFTMKWCDWMPWSSFFGCWVLNQLFHSPFTVSSRSSIALLRFCHKGGVICISEVIDISPGNLDSSLCFLFNLYAEYIMRNAWLEETQAGIKICRRNINNLRYADATTLMAGSEEELKSLLEEWNAWLKTQHSKN